MKLTIPITNTNGRFGRVLRVTAVALGIGLTCVGCSHAPEAPSVAQQQQSLQSQIQAIQNSPNMPPAAKAQAIAGIKAQQSRNATQP